MESSWAKTQNLFDFNFWVTITKPVQATVYQVVPNVNRPKGFEKPLKFVWKTRTCEYLFVPILKINRYIYQFEIFNFPVDTP